MQLLLFARRHDTVEDTDMTLEDIEEKFGEEVASIVKQVRWVSTLFRFPFAALSYLIHNWRGGVAVLIELLLPLAHLRHGGY